MKSSTKFWLAVFTFLPLAMILVFLWFFFTVMFEQIIELDQNHGEFPLSMVAPMFWFVMFIIITALVSLGIKIYYIVHTNNLPENSSSKKIMWTLILIFGGTIAAIVYYFMEITPLKQIEKNV